MIWITIPCLRIVLWMAWQSQCEPGWNIVCDGNMHGCEKVLRIPWLRACAPKHMDDCEPNSRAPFLTGRHGWLKIQSKCKQKLSNTHGWITNRPTQCLSGRRTDMWFVQNFTLSDFQAKKFTPSISPNFNSFSEKNTKKWVKMEKFTPLAKILHCRRQWREWQIPPLATTSLCLGTVGVLQTCPDHNQNGENWSSVTSRYLSWLLRLSWWTIFWSIYYLWHQWFCG